MLLGGGAPTPSFVTKYLWLSKKLKKLGVKDLFWLLVLWGWDVNSRDGVRGEG